MSRGFWRQLLRRPLGLAALFVIGLFCLMGIYAPFLASSKPLFVSWRGEWYFPLFRYLFDRGFYTKRIDLFFNLLMFTLPLFLLALCLGRRALLLTAAALQLLLFAYAGWSSPSDPASDPALNLKKQRAIQRDPLGTRSWQFELEHMTEYAKLNLLLQERLQKRLHAKIACRQGRCLQLPTLWEVGRERLQERRGLLEKGQNPLSEARLNYLKEKRKWIKRESRELGAMLMPLIRPFHWEDDAGGSQALNRHASWLDLTRINGKDLAAALIFGARISIVVGSVSLAIALLIGIPFGAFAGYYGGGLDIAMSRLLEVWESMPTLFILLLVVAITESKSIFLVIAIIGLFGWSGFCRFTRGECLKQRSLPYVEACRALGFSDRYTLFCHILPNALPPLLTLVPFAVMGAISTEAGLSFLGLGEENSCSWGVLMDEGRTAFPGESYLLWPPAALLTLLLVAIALLGDALRDCLDPKLHLEA